MNITESHQPEELIARDQKSAENRYKWLKPPKKGEKYGEYEHRYVDKIKLFNYNPLLHNLADVAEKYFLEWEVVNFNSAPETGGGDYMVVAYTGYIGKMNYYEHDGPRLRSNYEGRRITYADIRELLQRKKTEETLFYPLVNIFSLEYDRAAETYMELTEYCQHVEMIALSCADRDLEIPEVLPTSSVRDLVMLQENYSNPLIEESRREVYDKKIRELLNVKKSAPYIRVLKENECFWCPRTYYSEAIESKIEHSRPSLFSKKLSLKSSNKNQVSLETLINSCSSVVSTYIPVYYDEEFNKQLNRHKNILYSKTEMLGEKMNVPNYEGYGSEQKNDLRHYRYTYDREYDDRVTEISLRVMFPKVVAVSFSDMMSSHPLEIKFLRVRVFSRMFEELVKKCEACDIKISFVSMTERNNSVVLAFATNKENGVEEMLKEYIKETKRIHLAPTLHERKVKAQFVLNNAGAHNELNEQRTNIIGSI